MSITGCVKQNSLQAIQTVKEVATRADMGLTPQQKHVQESSTPNSIAMCRHPFEGKSVVCKPTILSAANRTRPQIGDSNVLVYILHK